ncbi:hypothetical protein SDRG_03198 [Saprolegnia diclina VS20]|uniref:Uncharacterized protein n=1 Tax=Saprolegnia diclina (strain VS20) TaxID=1156394 RepID=T0SAE0_SAPDV|nr:hypothetical protein SDRG_03198 [Saprolegnia diclina VS20]EQC39772.1 hypothetical protein SDRG_03198 [Saprolegnia diclina VS20]|eukprot:XP_008607044.1 hypothetical protein SDRG_03198 [Saprolegnia diclina VS20]
MSDHHKSISDTTKYDVVVTPKGDAKVDVATPAESEQKFSFLSLYRYGNGWDAALIGVGLLMSIVNGATLPQRHRTQLPHPRIRLALLGLRLVRVLCDFCRASNAVFAP